MNRNKEFYDMVNEIRDTPLELENTLARAKAKLKRKKQIIYTFTIPISSITACLAAFIMLINISPAFAEVCSSIPVVNKLATALNFTKSINSAIENEYYQTIEGLSQTQNGITLDIKYAIFDNKEISFFCDLDYDLELEKDDEYLQVGMMLNNIEKSHTIIQPYYQNGKNNLNCYTFVLNDNELPDTISLTAYVLGSKKDENKFNDTEYKYGNKLYSTFKFNIDINLENIKSANSYNIDKEINLDGQKLTITSIESFPTHTAVNIIADKKNTLEFRKLYFYIEDEEGNIYENDDNSIKSYGEKDLKNHMQRVDSIFFSDSKGFSLKILGAEWYDKELGVTEINLDNKTASNLPHNLELKEIIKNDEDIQVVFEGTTRYKHFDNLIFEMTHIYEKSTNYVHIEKQGTSSEAYFKILQITSKDKPYIYTTKIHLNKETTGTVYLVPRSSFGSILKKPITIKLK